MDNGLLKMFRNIYQQGRWESKINSSRGSTKEAIEIVKDELALPPSGTGSPTYVLDESHEGKTIGKWKV